MRQQYNGRWYDVVPGALSLANFTSADAATVTDEVVWMGTYKLKIGDIFAIGAGSSWDQNAALGRIYADIAKAGPLAVEGDLVLSLFDPQGVERYVAYTDNNVSLKTSATDPTQQKPLPMGQDVISYGWSVKWGIRAHGAGGETVDVSICTLNFAITRFRPL